MDVEKMIEAGVASLFDDHAERMGSPYRWQNIEREAKIVAVKTWGPRVRLCLTAAQAEWRAQGAALAVVPKPKGNVRGYAALVDYAEGFDAAIAAMREKEVVIATPPEKPK